MRSDLLLLGAVAGAVTLAACGADSGPSAAGPDVVIDTIGDTTVVRTLSGSVWEGDATMIPEVSIGELDGPEEYLFGWIWSIAVDDDRNVYVFDEQAQHVRVFDPGGSYVETLGGRGEGPGEFSRAEAIALLPDGRLVVRDPGNQRIGVFGPASGQTDQWAYNSGNSYSMLPLHTDANGRTFLMTRDPSRNGFEMHIVVFGPDGTQVDTLPEPSTPFDTPGLSATSPGRTCDHGRARSLQPRVPVDSPPQRPFPHGSVLRVPHRPRARRRRAPNRARDRPGPDP